MSIFRKWSGTLTDQQFRKLAEYLQPMSHGDLHTQAAWLVYSFWQMFVHHAAESGALHDSNGKPREEDAHRLGSLCATLDLELTRVLKEHGSDMPDDKAKLGYMGGYFASLLADHMKDTEEATVKAAWPMLLGALTGEHTIVVPLVTDGEGQVHAMVANVFDRSATAGDMADAFGPKIAPGQRIVAMLEMGRYMMVSPRSVGEDKVIESFGVNVVSAAGDLASLYLPLNPADRDCLIERVDGMVWRIDHGDSKEGKCMGLGPVEDCMMQYAQMLLQVDAPASDQGNQFDINTRGGIDPSLN